MEYHSARTICIGRSSVRGHRIYDYGHKTHSQKGPQSQQRHGFEAYWLCVGVRWEQKFCASHDFSVTWCMPLMQINWKRFSPVGDLMAWGSLEVRTFLLFRIPCCSQKQDPKWADPIKQRIRQMNQARAINEVVNALRPSPSGKADFNGVRELHVVNGMSTTSSSTLTTVAKENVFIGPTSPERPLELPAQDLLGKALKPHLEEQENELSEAQHILPKHSPRKIVPSLATLEKAVAARIYFENLYFAILRQPPSREQRRLAMENDMIEMNLTTGQKDFLRTRWLQNESEYLRARRKKVNVNAFVKLKTIGHGLSTVRSHQVEWANHRSYRRVWRCFSREGKSQRQSICYETGKGRGPTRLAADTINSCEKQTCCVKARKVIFVPNVIF